MSPVTPKTFSPTILLFAAALSCITLLAAAPEALAQAGQPQPNQQQATLPVEHLRTDDPGPFLSEERARELASEVPNVKAVLKNHDELERHTSYDTDARVWTVFWTLPDGFRRLLVVEISDRTGEILNSDVESEVYFETIPLLSEDEATDLARNQPRIQEELAGRQQRGGEISDSASFGTDRVWTVSFYDGPDQLAQVLVNDVTADVHEVMVGPQVAWQMARGYDGAFGRIVNEPYIWLPLCLLFLAPFINFRKPLRMVHLDLLVLLSFTVSHYYFNQGDISTSVPLAYPPLVYLFLRMGWIGFRRSRPHDHPDEARMHAARVEHGGPKHVVGETGAVMPHLNFPSWMMLSGIILLIIFRLVINIADSNVVDVGYSGVAGAHRILEGETPYGHMPADNSNGDTYGPMNYLLYVPFEALLPWSGEWDELPAAHAAAIFFDLATVAGLFLAGRQLMENRAGEGNRLGLALAFGWLAYPYTTFVQNCNVNDTVVVAFLVWGFVLLRKAPLAGAFLGLATGIKFFPAMLGPLWASFPDAFRRWDRRFLFAGAFLLAISIGIPVILLGDGTLAVFWERSLKWQIGRDSPFSIWGQYPDMLATVQRVAQYVLVALALAAFFWPRRKTMVQMAASSAALLIGFEMVQTHWFYLYIPWFFPLVLIAILAHGRGKPAKRSTIEGLDKQQPQLV